MGLAIVAEAFLQFLAGEENAALYSAERKIHFLSNLAVLVTGDVHGERNAVFVGEFADSSGDFLCTI